MLGYKGWQSSEVSVARRPEKEVGEQITLGGSRTFEYNKFSGSGSGRHLVSSRGSKGICVA